MDSFIDKTYKYMSEGEEDDNEDKSLDKEMKVEISNVDSSKRLNDSPII